MAANKKNLGAQFLMIYMCLSSKKQVNYMRLITPGMVWGDWAAVGRCGAVAPVGPGGGEHVKFIHYQS